MSAFAIIAAVMGQSETRIIKIEEVPSEVKDIETQTPPINEVIPEQTQDVESITEPNTEEKVESTEIINSTTTDNATATE